MLYMRFSPRTIWEPVRSKKPIATIARRRGRYLVTGRALNCDELELIADYLRQKEAK